MQDRLFQKRDDLRALPRAEADTDARSQSRARRYAADACTAELPKVRQTVKARRIDYNAKRLHRAHSQETLQI